MISDEKPLTPALQVVEDGNLRAQLELVNRLHMALHATLQADDLRSIILAVIISELGLGFDRAFFLEYDPLREGYFGADAMGSLDPERHQAIRRELLDEQRWFADRIEQFDGAADNPAAIAQSNLNLTDLKANAFWVDTIQRYSEETELKQRLTQIEIPCGKGSQQRLLCRIARSRHAVLLPATDQEFPAGVKSLIGSPAIAAPVKMGDKLHGIVIADLAFTGEKQIPAAMATLFEWFVFQAATALENALRYGQKESAYAELQEIDSIKSNFLSTISHELRTPLTAISGFTQILLASRVGKISDEQREFLMRIQRHTHHLGDMVEDLLELAESQHEGLAEADLHACDPLTALMNVIPRLEYRRRSKHVVIEPRIAGKVPSVLATEKALERVMFHLLDNAVKFSPTGGRVLVSFRTEGANLFIEIEDHGIGIAEENLKKIFEGFYQVDNRLIRNYQGLGIGLTLTKKLLMGIGGSIDVKSQVGEGTTIVVKFRVVRDRKHAHA